MSLPCRSVPYSTGPKTRGFAVRKWPTASPFEPLTKGDLLIVATDREPEKSIERYKGRWEIETLFSCLKSRRFNFEETRQRIEAMFGVLALASHGLIKSETGDMKINRGLALNS